MYKFYLDFGAGDVEVFPLGFNSSTLIDEKERDQVFYRTKFGGELVFHGYDYEQIWTQELADPCKKITLLIERLDAGAVTYHTYWEGYFTTSDGSFDLDRCTFSVTPFVDDQYDLILNNGNREHNILEIVLNDIEVNTATQLYDRNMWLVDVIEYLAEQVVPGIGIESSFFTANINPVTLQDNQFKYITLAQKSDIKTPNSSDRALTGLLSFTELMNILKTMFNVYWDYDGTDLIIEHISYFDAAAGMDLRTQKLHDATNKYRYLKEEMPKFEKFSFMESFHRDFVGVPIWYDSLCVNQDPDNNTRDYSVLITTDLDFIAADPDSVSESGFVMLANYLLGGVYYVSFGYGILSSDVQYNMRLSWTHLHNNFHRHDRILSEGYLNNNLETFFSSRKNKNQELYAVICQEDDYTPDDYMTTSLGVTFSEDAHVLRAERKPSGETLLSLVYGPEPLAPAPIPSPIAMWIRIAAPNFTVDLSRPHSMDINFWMRLDATTCQEVLIPAGDIHYSDALDDALPVEFNFTDPSLNTIEIYLNDGETIDLTIACPAAPPVPDVTCNSVGTVANGDEYDRISVTANCTNSGDAGNATLEWRIKNSSGSVVDSGDRTLNFAVGVQNKAIPSLLYPAAGINYTLEAKMSTDAVWRVSNQFNSLAT